MFSQIISLLYFAYISLIFRIIKFLGYKISSFPEWNNFKSINQLAKSLTTKLSVLKGTEIQSIKRQKELLKITYNSDHLKEEADKLLCKQSPTSKRSIVKIRSLT